jgi:hypothetical protein
MTFCAENWKKRKTHAGVYYDDEGECLFAVSLVLLMQNVAALCAKCLDSTVQLH